ncbi:hypothetical protein Pcinc_043022 [Petrolisthes cinctipes]|uniref:Uncharacterized protein n=1 Tax=Petrolisthes cinctipes TaxID=88211 RepID=A0AAE1EGG3_PETCI|nr:hypothetical protein Pcinc_043022 [Petrolisthes cinctipes]
MGGGEDNTASLSYSDASHPCYVYQFTPLVVQGWKVAEPTLHSYAPVKITRRIMYLNAKIQAAKKGGELSRGYQTRKVSWTSSAGRVPKYTQTQVLEDIFYFIVSSVTDTDHVVSIGPCYKNDMVSIMQPADHGHYPANNQTVIYATNETQGDLTLTPMVTKVTTTTCFYI